MQVENTVWRWGHEPHFIMSPWKKQERNKFSHRITLIYMSVQKDLQELRRMLYFQSITSELN